MVIVVYSETKYKPETFSSFVSVKFNFNRIFYGFDKQIDDKNRQLIVCCPADKKAITYITCKNVAGASCLEE